MHKNILHHLQKYPHRGENMPKSNMKIGIICLVILVFALGAVSASDNSTDTLKLDDTSQNEISADETNDLLTENVTKSKPQISVEKIEGNQGQTLTLKATVKKEDGSASPANVTFKFNGQTYTAATDSDGVASVTLKFPKSAVLKTTSKTKGKILTKTTYYQKSYTCDVTADGDGLETGTASFNVISKNTPLIKKYKIIKKKKTYTLTLKKGVKIGKGYKLFKKGNYAFITYTYKKKKRTYIETVLISKTENFLKFSIKHHIKYKGKWKWDSWSKTPKNRSDVIDFIKSVKVDKIKVKYTQVSYKKI